MFTTFPDLSCHPFSSYCSKTVPYFSSPPFPFPCFPSYIKSSSPRSLAGFDPQSVTANQANSYDSSSRCLLDSSVRDGRTLLEETPYSDKPSPALRSLDRYVAHIQLPSLPSTLVVVPCNKVSLSYAAILVRDWDSVR